jgi:hypothetical protein
VLPFQNQEPSIAIVSVSGLIVMLARNDWFSGI